MPGLALVLPLGLTESEPEGASSFLTKSKCCLSCFIEFFNNTSFITFDTSFISSIYWSLTLVTDTVTGSGSGSIHITCLTK